MALSTENKLYISLGVLAVLGGALFLVNKKDAAEAESYTESGQAAWELRRKLQDQAWSIQWLPSFVHPEGRVVQVVPAGFVEIANHHAEIRGRVGKPSLDYGTSIQPKWREGEVGQGILDGDLGIGIGVVQPDQRVVPWIPPGGIQCRGTVHRRRIDRSVARARFVPRPAHSETLEDEVSPSGRAQSPIRGIPHQSGRQDHLPARDGRQSDFPEGASPGASIPSTPEARRGVPTVNEIVVCRSGGAGNSDDGRVHPDGIASIKHKRQGRCTAQGRAADRESFGERQGHLMPSLGRPGSVMDPKILAGVR